MAASQRNHATPRIIRWVMKTITALIFVGILTNARPAQAQWIVFDPSVFAQTLAEVENTIQVIKQAEEMYLLVNSVYQGFHDWQNFGWVEILDMVDLPFFDGVAGIDDLRDLASMTEMSLEDLQQLFAEAATLQRLKGDPTYRQSRTRAKMIDLMSEAHQRSRMRKVVFVRALKQHQREMDRLKAQARDLQDQLQVASSNEPANEAAISGIQAKLQVILIRQQTLKDSLWDLMKTDEMKAQQDEELFRSYMREAGLQDTTTEVHDAMKLARDFLGIRG